MEKREEQLVKVLDILVIDEKTLGFCLQANDSDGQKRELSSNSIL